MLQGKAKETADKVVDLPEAKRNIRRLLTTENLIKYKFLNPDTEPVAMKQSARQRKPARETVPRVSKSPKVARARDTAREKAKGKRPRVERTYVASRTRGLGSLAPLF